MGSYSLPSPPADQRASLLRKNSSSSAKPVEPVHCRLKGVSSSAAMMHHHYHRPHSPGMDGPRKRVRKACERCRMKKTKCDGEFPCMRCKNDNLICTAAARKKTGYKELPGGYGSQ
ncbi:hypothetical protein HZS61_007488 [Fusarium oxysporum f. sp. conglutinans]|uniref:Zn(2)-C6 fungal-type domain-containing protein n=1 Tax=Fusarium oxysporum f. sp. conglutinans TaxID=100902 RepID=A0A8H6LBN3_FUSOX|nr:hypothetical protein HZS61_007488 [Fusarium oxysporum f. sp. conglutinans]